MKTYIVYLYGREVGYIKAGSHNSAEKKAKKKYIQLNSDGTINDHAVSVVYTEL